LTKHSPSWQSLEHFKKIWPRIAFYSTIFNSCCSSLFYIIVLSRRSSDMALCSVSVHSPKRGHKMRVFLATAISEIFTGGPSCLLCSLTLFDVGYLHPNCLVIKLRTSHLVYLFPCFKCFQIFECHSCLVVINFTSVFSPKAVDEDLAWLGLRWGGVAGLTVKATFQFRKRLCNYLTQS